jgi:hypothetical protein
VSLGHGERAITDQGDEAVSPGFIFSPGGRRTVSFLGCKLLGVDPDFEIDGQKVSEVFTEIYVQERSPGRPLWSERPWQIGAVAANFTRLGLHVSPVAFEQFWELVDVPENERPVINVAGQVDPHGVLLVYEVTLHVQPRTHPVARAFIERQGQISATIQSVVSYVVCVLLVIELIRWLWR